MNSQSPPSSNRFWLLICTISLACYLLFSEAVPGFVREVARLAEKL